MRSGAREEALSSESPRRAAAPRSGDLGCRSLFDRGWLSLAGHWFTTTMINQFGQHTQRVAGM